MWGGLAVLFFLVPVLWVASFVPQWAMDALTLLLVVGAGVLIDRAEQKVMGEDK